MDFRVLVQKDGIGQWVRTFTFAKVSKRGAIVSNVATGAAVWDADKVLASMVEDPQALKALIESLAVNVAKSLDQYLGPFCELGIDIGVDTNGHPWVIEVNSKFSRKVFPKRIHIKSIKLILQYLQFLMEVRQGVRVPN